MHRVTIASDALVPKDNATAGNACEGAQRDAGSAPVSLLPLFAQEVLHLVYQLIRVELLIMQRP